MLKATLTDDWGVKSIEFDAAPHLMTATQGTIDTLREEGWTGCSEADAIGSEQTSEEITKFFADLEVLHEWIGAFRVIDAPCYEVTIDPDEAEAWLAANRPDIAAMDESTH
jgi:hypothetical protein